jgi:dTDP-4-dehydrorhamnose 3,5-epimerase
MKLTQTDLAGVLILDLKYFEDLRGQLLKPFSQESFANLGLNLDFKEAWFTFSKKDVIRGMHMQVGEKACAKLVCAIGGKVIDVILDARPESPTYGKHLSLMLDSKNPQAIIIPPYCSHGYRVLEHDTKVLYMATEVHVAKDDVGYRWDSFGYDWNLRNPILSDKDKALPPFSKNGAQ